MSKQISAFITIEVKLDSNATLKEAEADCKRLLKLYNAIIPPGMHDDTGAYRSGDSGCVARIEDAKISIVFER